MRLRLFTVCLYPALQGCYVGHKIQFKARSERATAWARQHNFTITRRSFVINQQPHRLCTHCPIPGHLLNTDTSIEEEFIGFLKEQAESGIYVPLCPVFALGEELDATQGGLIATFNALSFIDGQHVGRFPVTGKLSSDPGAKIAGYQFAIVDEWTGFERNLGRQLMPQCDGDGQPRQRQRNSSQRSNS